MNYNRIVIPQFPLELAYSLDIWERFDIPYSSSYFSDDNIILATLTKKLYTVLDFVGNMRDHLHCFAKELSTAFFFDDTLVDTTSGHIVSLRGEDIEETFVMA